MNLILVRRFYDTFRKVNSPALVFGLLLIPVVWALAIVALRISLTLFYGGGAHTFDRRYEAHVAEQIEQSETPQEIFALLAGSWQPKPPWQREFLATPGTLEDLCTAEVDRAPDGRGILMVACSAEEGYTTEGALSAERRDLEDELRDRALRVIARTLRIGEARLAAIGMIGVYQKLILEPGDEAVYFVTLELPPQPPGLDSLLAGLDERVRVIENTAQGRKRPLTSR